jgi:hypothetical protein
MTAPVQPRHNKISRAANGHECYELPDAKPSFVRVVLDALTKEHGFVLLREPAVGVDEIAAEVQRGDVRLYVGWDNWMGLDILSLSDSGDSVIRELASYFDARKDDHRYDPHFEHSNAA